MLTGETSKSFLRLTQNVTVTQLTARSAAANCAATVPLIILSDKSIMSLVAETKESLYTFAKNVAYKTIRITGVIIDENNIPLSLKKSFLFLLTSAVISFITDHLPIFSQSQQEIHRPYHLLRLHNHGISPDVSQSFS